MNFNQLSLEFHRKNKGKIELRIKGKLENKEDLSILYTPGVAEPCRVIAKDKSESYNLTSKANTVAVITDGSAVLGLGNIGPEAALPVMEGKCALFKRFGDVDAWPICLATQDTEEIIKAVKMIAPGFGGINLEDISAPRCFEIEERLKKELDIPIFHDDQHGTAIVVLAGLINALKIVGKNVSEIKVVVNGVGAAGVATTKLLQLFGVKDIVLVDSKGVIYKGREDLNDVKIRLSEETNQEILKGGLAEAVIKRDVFIGVSQGGILTDEMVKTMNKDGIIFAMANPTPEIMPDVAKKAGAKVIATGRSDFPNQINNVLVFPGIFRGAFDGKIKNITDEMKLEAAKAIANLIENPTPDRIIPDPFDERVANTVAESVRKFGQN